MHNLMKKSIIFLLLLLTADSLFSLDIKLKEGYFFIDGEKFFIKGMGYEAGTRRGSIPYLRKFEPELLNADFKRIAEAGFNTIRTWAPLTADELKIVRDHGLKVILGLWVDQEKFFRGDDYDQTARQLLHKDVNTAKKFDNVIAYLVLNEPPPQLIQETGLERVREKLNLLKTWVKEMDNKRPVSFASYLWIDYVDMSDLDFVAFNNYCYAPVSITRGIGYRGYNAWLVKKYFPKPVIITEFGLSVSPDGPGKFGYGGNSLEEQKQGDLLMYNDIIQAGCSGGCAFMWVDGWWKYKDKDTHDPHPEEWYGIIGLEKDDTPIEGIPRPVYFEYKKYNSVIWTKPSEDIYSVKDLSVEIFYDNQKYNVTLSVNDNPVKLKRRHNWLTGRITLAKEKNTVILVVKEKDNVIKTETRTLFYSEKDIPLLTYDILEKEVQESDKIRIIGLNKDRDIRVTLFNPLKGIEFNQDCKGPEISLNSQGFLGLTQISLSCSRLNFRQGAVDWVNVKTISEDQLKEGIKNLKKQEIYGFEFNSDLRIREEFKTEYAGDSVVERRVSFKNKTKGNSALELIYTPQKPGSWYYMEKVLNTPWNFSGVKYFSVMIDSDDSENEFKFMLIDTDGERYLKTPELIKGRGWKEYLFSVKQLGRDPYDNIKSGNQKLDLDSITGIAIVFASPGSANSSHILLDEFSCYK